MPCEEVRRYAWDVVSREASHRMVLEMLTFRDRSRFKRQEQQQWCAVRAVVLVLPCPILPVRVCQHMKSPLYVIAHPLVWWCVRQTDMHTIACLVY